MLAQKRGKIIIQHGANVWPHELDTARILSRKGHTVEFIRPSNRIREYNVNIFLDGVLWEIKSPTAKHTRGILGDLKKARWQSDKVIFDSSRMKGVPDQAIMREIKKCLFEIKGITSLIYISKKGKIIYIL